jgi:hypothetical protein
MRSFTKKLQIDAEFAAELRQVEEICEDFFGSSLETKLASAFPTDAPSMQGSLHLRGSGYSKSAVREHLHIVIGAPDCFQALTPSTAAYSAPHYRGSSIIAQQKMNCADSCDLVGRAGGWQWTRMDRFGIREVFPENY